jgi:hypothetical protein
LPQSLFIPESKLTGDVACENPQQAIGAEENDLQSIKTGKNGIETITKNVRKRKRRKRIRKRRSQTSPKDLER